MCGLQYVALVRVSGLQSTALFFTSLAKAPPVYATVPWFTVCKVKENKNITERRIGICPE